MADLIHATAHVDASAVLHDGVKIGPGAFVGPDVEIGEDSEVGANAQIHGPTRIGRQNRIYPLACVGFDPQDLKYEGEESWLEVGDRNVIREFSTLNRGTGFGGGVTRLGDDNLLMAYSHIGHDSQVGSRTIFVNGGTLAGHVEVGDDATIGAYSAVQQFCRVGRFAYIGGYSVITLDALPYGRTVGQKPRCFGLNRVGLERKGYTKEQIKEIDGALRLLLRSGLNTSQALEQMRAIEERSAEVDELIRFVETSERGVIKSGARRGRGDSR